VAHGPVDPFGHTDELDDRTLAALAARFEARGRHAMFLQMLDEYVDAMHVEHLDAVLDVGCGTGVATRAVAQRSRFAGRVTGVDLSPYLVSEAQRLAREEGVADRVEFDVGDACRIDAAGGMYDAVVAHTLLSHVDDPAVLAEVARVLRVGGVLGVFDGDYASLTFGHPDPVRAQAYDDALVRSVVTSPRVMRDMPRLLRAAGFELVTSFAHVLSEVGAADYWASAIDVYRRLLPQAGLVTEADADARAAQLRSDSAAGVFFASCNYYAYVATRT
jgi:ubiquinone/menaquinone biosynthesis C-methylase UbiE